MDLLFSKGNRDSKIKCGGLYVGSCHWMGRHGNRFYFFNDHLGIRGRIFLPKDSKRTRSTYFLGFASGVMIAASVWSLLIPAIEEAEASGGIGWLPAAGGFVLGRCFFSCWIAFCRIFIRRPIKPKGFRPLRRTTLLVSAVTLHNIPEGWRWGYPLLWRLSTAIRDFIRRLCFGAGYRHSKFS